MFKKTDDKNNRAEPGKRVVASNHPTPTALLQNTLKVTGLRSEAAQVFQEWPSMKTATLKYCEYVSDLVPGKNGEPLLHESIRKAVDAYHSFPSSDFYARVRGFIRAMVADAPMLLKHRLAAEDVEGRWMCWEPFTEPIMRWVKRQIHPTIRIVPADNAYEMKPVMARMMLLSAIFRYHDLAVIDLDIDSCLFNPEGAPHD